jgi:G protein-coupled receptor GPR1
MFIYPLAYMAMWVLPFASHALQYNDYYATSPPFILSAFVTVIITGQSAVDCWIFNVKEKPWRPAVKIQRRECEGLAFFKNLTSRRLSSQFRNTAGKSKAAMDAEATCAYRRRDEERAARASEMSNAGRSERRERSWWDEPNELELNARMSPLVESATLPSNGEVES